ncbi:MAG: fibronectin type III domain-containing protein [Gammaproteobacteria bacterium]
MRKFLRNSLLTGALLLLTLSSGCMHELNKLKGSPPPQPQGLKLLGVDNGVLVSWDAPEINVAHDLYFTPEGGEEDIVENITNPYIHQGLTNGVLYTYQLVARNSVGKSPRTPPLSVMPVAFTWQEPWGAPVVGGNFPLCKEDGATDQCLVISNNSNWYTSRWHSGPKLNAALDQPLTYIKLFKNFDMTANGTTYTMAGSNGLNMTVENLQPAFLEVRNLNIPVTAFTDLFIRAHEAILTDNLAYTYIEIAPTTFVSGSTCLGRKVRYILATGSDQAVASIPAEAGLKIVELGKISEFFRHNIFADLDCADSAYAIGTLRLGIEGAVSDNNWARFDTVGLIGPPLT